MTDDRHPFITLNCSHCGHPLKVQLTCGERTCPDCRKKWFGYHYKSLLRLLEHWPTVHLLTLTYKNIPNEYFGPSSVRKIRRDFGRLRREKFPEILGGFYVVQATNAGNDWHLHIHIVFDGFFIAHAKLSRAWREITKDSYIVHVRDVQDPKRALRYLLADFAGTPRIRPEDYAVYNQTFQGSRLVQGFGKYRRTRLKFKAPPPCPECGCDVWIRLDSLFDEKRSSRRKRSEEDP